MATGTRLYAPASLQTPRRDVHGEHDDKPPEARLDVPVSEISREYPQSTKFDA
ncbi:hypothetical protein BD309DRAFT_961851 [Dichomitus squalens]|nr:hypothetical protein BD309DRAFT_961851 [Dichomitus squalens]